MRKDKGDATFPWDVFSGHRFIANRYVPPKIFPENLSHDKKQIGIILIVIFFLAENSYCQEKEYEILLTLRTDKEIYQVGEEILVDFVFKNITPEPIGLIILESDVPLYHFFEFYDQDGNEIRPLCPLVNYREGVLKRKNILAGKEYVSRLQLNNWRLRASDKNYNSIGSEPGKIQIKGIYSMPKGMINEKEEDGKIFFDKLESGIIAIEIISLES